MARSHSQTANTTIRTELTRRGWFASALGELDEIPEITDATKIDLLKIDVEGYELSVLYGATEVLARTKLVYFESYQENCAPFGTSTADVTDSLYDAGFYVVKAETRTPINRGHVSMNLENLLGINPALQHYTKGSAG